MVIADNDWHSFHHKLLSLDLGDDITEDQIVDDS